MVISPFHLYSHSSNQLYFTSHPCLSKYICPNLKDALPTTQTRNTRRMDFCLDSNLSSNFFGQSRYSLIEIIPRWKIEYVLQWLKSKDHDHNPPCATWIPGLQLFPSSAISLPHWLTLALYSPVQAQPNGNTTPDKKKTIATTFASPVSKWIDPAILPSCKLSIFLLVLPSENTLDPIKFKVIVLLNRNRHLDRY